MSDLIDRANLLAEIQLAIEDSGCVNHEREIIDCVRYAPTIDAVQVVRCKDCTNRNTCVCPLEYAIRWGIGNDELHDDDFCSYGERMDADAPERGEGSGE